MPLANPITNQAAMATLEKYLETISTSFSTVARKEGGIRDAFDDMARAHVEFVRGPHVYNPTLKTALESYAAHLVAAQDYRQAKLAQFENNIVPLLTKLSTDCKQMKSMRMRTFSGSEQKLSSSQNLNESSLTRQSGSLDALAQQSKTESELVNFERSKLQHLKKTLTDAVVLELAFYSRAIEQLSPILAAMAEINVEGDLQDYCKTVLGIASGGPAGIRSESAASLQSRSQQSPINVNPTARKATTSVPPVPSVTTVKQQQQSAFKAGSRSAPDVQVSTSFDDEEEEEYEGEEYETTDASAAGGPGNWVPPRGPALRQPGRPFTGAQGPPVPDRSAAQSQQPKPVFKQANLFLGSSAGSGSGGK